MATLTKDGETITLENINHIAGFKAGGWTETEERPQIPEEKPAEKPKATPKAAPKKKKTT